MLAFADVVALIAANKEDLINTAENLVEEAGYVRLRLN